MKAALLNDTRNDLHWGCFTVIQTIKALCRDFGIDLVATFPARYAWEKDPYFVKTVNEIDLLIVNGEGTIHHNRPAGKRLLQAGAYAKSRGKRSVLINMTWQDNSFELTSLVRKFDLISVRESSSASELRRQNIECRIVPDLALNFVHDTPVNRRGIGFTDNVLSDDLLDTYQVMRMHNAELIQMFYGRSGFKGKKFFIRRFLSHQDIVNPVKLLSAVRAGLTDYRSQINTIDIFSETVASKELIVTGRFHMLIYALATRTPFLVFESNTHKISATLRDSGLNPKRLINLSHIDEDSISWAAQWHDDEVQKLTLFIERGRASARDLFSDIYALV